MDHGTIPHGQQCHRMFSKAEEAKLILKLEDIIVQVVYDLLLMMSLNGQDTLSLSLTNSRFVYPCHRTSMKFVGFLKLLSTIYKLILENHTITKRDFYYSNVNLFPTQRSSDELIATATCFFDVPRNRLKVVAANKGLVQGNIYIELHGMVYNCSQVVQIPGCLEDASDIQGSFDFVLVVEKETVFRRLVDMNFHALHNCVVVTGKGYPDINTRSFLVELDHRYPDICIFGLVDADPYGLDIYRVYKYGSEAMYQEIDLQVESLIYIGLKLEDIPKSSRHRVKLTEYDYKKIKSLQRINEIEQDEDINYELKLMKLENGKAEIEAVESIFGLEQYILDKIHEYECH